MRNAILIHGSCDKDEYFSDKYPSLSNSHWFPWLQKQLLIKGIFTQTPEMPKPYLPIYEDWKREFERFDTNVNTTLVGHSCGGGFLVRWLSENQTKIDKLFLIAPWLDPSNKRTDTFFNFVIDPNIQKRVNEFHLFFSTDDDTEGVVTSVKEIKNAFSNLNYHEFKNLGHFTYEEMKTEKLPELLKAILQQ